MGLKWLKHFDRATAKRTNSRYRLLILDGHESHHSVKFEGYCKENNIITLCMPSHASHLLQPLDVGCFGPLKKAYGQEIEHLIRCFINHITKTKFFPAFHTAHQAAITESNIKGGFRGAGLAPFDPENVISKLDVQLRIPTPPVEVTIPLTPWTARTPKTVVEAQLHSKYLQGRIKNHKSSSPESIIQAVKHFEKATTNLMDQMALLHNRNQQLKQQNKTVGRRRKGKRTKVQKEGAVTIGEALQAIDQMDVNAQVTAESSRGGQCRIRAYLRGKPYGLIKKEIDKVISWAKALDLIESEDEILAVPPIPDDSPPIEAFGKPKSGGFRCTFTGDCRTVGANSTRRNEHLSKVHGVEPDRKPGPQSTCAAESRDGLVNG
jgi:hypothetical protein